MLAGSIRMQLQVQIASKLEKSAQNTRNLYKTKDQNIYLW
jgi:hypothetical protein